MKDATPRMKALLAGSAALLVFGVVIPANANPEVRPSGTTTEFVGKAYLKANPKGQSNNDTNSGFTCDDNKGAGQPGHPALPHDCTSTVPVPEVPDDGTNTDTGWSEGDT